MVASQANCIANGHTPLIISHVTVSWIIDGCCFTTASVVFGILSCFNVKNKIIEPEMSLKKASYRKAPHNGDDRNDHKLPQYFIVLTAGLCLQWVQTGATL